MREYYVGLLYIVASWQVSTNQDSAFSHEVVANQLAGFTHQVLTNHNSWFSSHIFSPQVLTNHNSWFSSQFFSHQVLTNHNSRFSSLISSHHVLTNQSAWFSSDQSGNMVQPSYPDQSEDMVQTPTSINASVGVHTSKNTSPFNIKGGPLSPPTSSLTHPEHSLTRATSPHPLAGDPTSHTRISSHNQLFY